MSDPAALKVKDLHKSFGAHDVIKGVSLEAQKGEVIAILGASGSGKSTFLRCINLLETPNSGEVWLAGEQMRMTRNRRGETVPEDIRQVERMRAKLAMVFQGFNLWSHMTVMENVLEGPLYVQKTPKAEAREKAAALLEKVGLSDRADYYPAHLSGGQQQRVAIARALAMDPDVMLFDEPTSALDPELVGEVLSVMRDLADEGRTMLVVTHEMGFARDVSSKTVFLHQGEVCEQGPPAQLFSNPETPEFQAFLSRMN
ncbi:amino acid ABC transporter ATP-binding protein, PAAT family [Roseovarius nanhaiticus]|uniref:Amino acid ABC transporter ATP-binding protein, PAAT family n=1 Tax=Roseovarius nanhaiticus TaxID=573024 RepID=A0A1N7G918_9RHOB|nr:ATP-binding cassette domain-containing protein [Roseovarius nanhaiticus]SEK33750.1 amino acid ABC transporter ATP-binding protein, PAAT family [Roseovarius nanhaiticus]SIS09085.1 amino acid ABC transporter ATP-binding protein, PAAT family [Roseovarius nanhaiticus]